MHKYSAESLTFSFLGLFRLLLSIRIFTLAFSGTTLTITSRHIRSSRWCPAIAIAHRHMFRHHIWQELHVLQVLGRSEAIGSLAMERLLEWGMP